MSTIDLGASISRCIRIRTIRWDPAPIASTSTPTFVPSVVLGVVRFLPDLTYPIRGDIGTSNTLTLSLEGIQQLLTYNHRHNTCEYFPFHFLSHLSLTLVINWAVFVGASQLCRSLLQVSVGIKRQAECAELFFPGICKPRLGCMYACMHVTDMCSFSLIEASLWGYGGAC